MINMNLEEVALRAWADREAANGRILLPGEDDEAIGEVYLHGYAHDDCIAIAFIGPLRVDTITQEDFFRCEYAPRENGIVDTYYGVEPLGWEAPGRSTWIFGPDYCQKNTTNS